jgi:cyclopropane fatty-acyl-phospholipid synthase-like methyltransferase
MDSSGRFFDGFAETFDSFYDGKRSPAMQWVDQRFRRDMFVRFSLTFDFLGNLEGSRVLDIGCGSGPYVAEALKRGAAQVIGIDPAPSMLELARRRVAAIGMRERVQLLHGYFPQICPTEPADFAIVMGVMDYVEDAAAFLRGLRSVVSQKAALSFPSVHWFRSPLRQFRYRLRRCPVHFYTRDAIEALVRELGVRDYTLTKIPGAGLDYVLCLSLQ